MRLILVRDFPQSPPRNYRMVSLLNHSQPSLHNRIALGHLHGVPQPGGGDV